MIANGSAKRTEKAPGHFDERAEGFDDALGQALRGGDSTGLAAIDESLARELWADVDAFRSLGADIDLSGADIEVDYDAAPYGVQYWVTRCDMRILIDEAGATGVATDLAEALPRPALPWLRVNMVSTLDGAANGESGKSGSINNEADKRVFHALRQHADAIVVGAGTARTERYRVAAVPLVVVSHRGLVPEQLRDAPPRQGAPGHLRRLDGSRRRSRAPRRRPRDRAADRRRSTSLR